MDLNGLRNRLDSFCGFSIDTSLLLVLLGLETGRTADLITVDAFLLLLTMALTVVLPYFLLANGERPSFAKWLSTRTLIAIFSVITGALLGLAYGTLLPEYFRFMPLTLLIFAAMATCLIRFYGLMRLRLAK